MEPSPGPPGRAGGVRKYLKTCFFINLGGCFFSALHSWFSFVLFYTVEYVSTIRIVFCYGEVCMDWIIHTLTHRVTNK